MDNVGQKHQLGAYEVAYNDLSDHVKATVDDAIVQRNLDPEAQILFLSLRKYAEKNSQRVPMVHALRNPSEKGIVVLYSNTERWPYCSLFTDDLYVMVFKAPSRAFQLQYNYLLIAPTVEQEEGTFNPEEHILFSRRLIFVPARGGQIAFRPNGIQIPNYVPQYDEDGNEKRNEQGQIILHPCCRQSTNQQTQRVTYSWDASAMTNIGEQQFLSFVGTMLRDAGLIDPEVLAKLPGAQAATGGGYAGQAARGPVGPAPAPRGSGAPVPLAAAGQSTGTGVVNAPTPQRVPAPMGLVGRASTHPPIVPQGTPASETAPFQGEQTDDDTNGGFEES